jgi:hypothetical protein
MNDNRPETTRRELLKAAVVVGWASAHADYCAGGEREQHGLKPILPARPRGRRRTSSRVFSDGYTPQKTGKNTYFYVLTD